MQVRVADIAASCIRECREELDILIQPEDVFCELIHEYPDISIQLTLFNASISHGVPKKLEHNDLKWITVREIDDYAFCPADEQILKKLKECYVYAEER